MTIDYTKRFLKQYYKQPKKMQKKFNKQLSTFKTNPYNPLLSNHLLKGKYSDYRSINVTGDVRALYNEKNG